MKLTDILDGLTRQQGPNGPDTWPEGFQRGPKRLQMLRLVEFLVEVRRSKCRLAPVSSGVPPLLALGRTVLTAGHVRNVSLLALNFKSTRETLTRWP
jgi:hypothetical protein